MANLLELVQTGHPLTDQQIQRLVPIIIGRVVDREGAPASLAPELIQVGERGRISFESGRRIQTPEFMAPEELLETYREQGQEDGSASLRNARLFSAGLIIYWLYYGNYYDRPGRRVTGLPAAGSAKASGSLIAAADCPGNPFAAAMEMLTKYKGSREEGASMILNRQAHSQSPAGTPSGQEGSGRYLCLSIDEKDSSKVPLFSVGTGEYQKTVHGVCGIRRMKFWKTDRRGENAELACSVEWPFPPEEKHNVVIGCNAQGRVCRIAIADRPSVHWDIVLA